MTTIDAAARRHFDYEDTEVPERAAGPERTAARSRTEAAHLDAAPPVQPGWVAKVAVEKKEHGFFAAIGSFFSGLGGALFGAGRAIFEGAWDAITAIPKAIFSNPRSVGDLLWKVTAGVVSTIVSPLLRGVQAIQSLTGTQAPERPLSASEQALARKIFGKKFDVSAVRVHDGDAGILENSGRPLTVGNDIYAKRLGAQRGDAGYRAVLMHELVHSWQHQQGGITYAARALGAQIAHRSEAYNWKVDAARNVPFSDLNPEQQAKLLEDAVASGYFDEPNAENKPFITESGQDYTAYLKAALHDIREGRGA